MDTGDFGGSSTDGPGSSSLSGRSTETSVSFASTALLDDPGGGSDLSSSSVESTGKVTDAVDTDDFGGSSTGGLGFSTGDVLSHVDMNYAIHIAGLPLFTEIYISIARSHKKDRR